MKMEERSQDSDAQFEAEVQVGKGLRFIDRHGYVTINSGRLTLCKRNGEVIAEAPMSEIRAYKSRFSGGAAARIWIDDDKYTIEPLRVHRYLLSDSVGGSASNLSRDVMRLKRGRELTEEFLRVVEGEGGQLSEP